MNWLKTSYRLMKKHELLSVFYPWVAMMAWCVVVLVFYPSCTYVLCVMLAFTVMSWCIDKAYSKEGASLKEAELADTKDKLCLAEHKVKQLELELELKRPGASRTSMKGEPTDETEQQKGNPNTYKRRQVLKRKPKTEMNENKD